MEKALAPDKLIEDIGGCGRYQIRLNVLVHVIKTAICWTLTTMAVVAKTPPWWCADDEDYNMTSESNESMLMRESCVNRNGSACQRIVFDGSMNTIISEFGLVCDRAFIPTTIMSIQTVGMFIGNPLSGQIADLIGRKRPFFVSLFLLAAGNLVCYFSTNWVVFAICRLIVGIGSAFFLTVQYNLLSEFSLASWRPWITGFPSWPIEACMFAFIAWRVSDWRYLQLICCITSAVCLLSWRFIPESFRWYLSHDRHKDAEDVIRGVAKVNKHPVPDLQNLYLIDDTGEDDHKKYTFLHLFKSRYVAKVTILCSSNWFALGFISYGLIYGIQSMSGNIFLNLFLFQITGIPVKCLSSYLLNRIGRKKTSLICFLVTCIGGFTVGIVQRIDTGYRDELTNGFALFANMGITAAWGSVQTMTIELYPTVIRNIGFGSLSTVGRVGAMVGPQIIFLNTIIPGTLFFACGGISVICIVALMFLPETMGGNLPDKMKEMPRVI